MKTPNKCPILVVTLLRDGQQGGGLPDFIVAAHRHFQKELPESMDATVQGQIGSVFRAPVDLIRLVVPSANLQALLVDPIEEVLIGYKPKKAN